MIQKDMCPVQRIYSVLMNEKSVTYRLPIINNPMIIMLHIEYHHLLIVLLFSLILSTLLSKNDITSR